MRKNEIIAKLYHIIASMLDIRFVIIAMENKEGILRYTGLEELKQQLIQYDETITSEQEAAFKILENTERLQKKAKESKNYIDKKSIKPKNLKIKKLSKYFKNIKIHPEKFSSNQKAEYTLLNKKFNIDTALYISIPVYNEGLKDMVFIVFEATGKKLVEKNKEVLVKITNNAYGYNLNSLEKFAINIYQNVKSYTNLFRSTFASQIAL